MLVFAITDARTDHELCRFTVPWALSVPLFREVAAGYFPRVPSVGAVLLNVAIDEDGPWVMVCRADRKADAPRGVELTAGPLLLMIAAPSLH
jgi:hypothetical protein